MEPRRDDGDDQTRRTVGAQVVPAAMEPRRDDGDDPEGHREGRGQAHAAMEPRRDDGDDQPVLVQLPHRDDLPQWSPVVTTGTTRHDGPAECQGSAAAMEPRRDDGDDTGQVHRGHATGQGRNGAPS